MLHGGWLHRRPEVDVGNAVDSIADNMPFP